ncbi:DUF2812 domain-containing protein [Faecalitalea cylindroides]|uniref:DUF2812 domain-containing protein n=1 Tax=Faecalitalea cylindroides TaxID=39483 RepID=UPI00195D2E44|nr:DUF2812 domain-containing protein [Faecalitalea cylindroides]MBM6652086.1 DUF2812 domain-containing protein [Faecalitalea cylindroides]
MPNETKDKTTLEKLKELQENDTISSLDFEEPELKTFDVTNIFEIDDEQKKPEKKKFTFGKRANRHASQVKIKTNEFDNTQPIIEDIRFSQELKDIEGDSPSEPEEVVENQPEPVQEQPLEKENIPEETAKPVIEDKEVVEEVITSEVVETPETIEEDVEEVEEFEELEEYDEEDEVEEEEINDSDETEAVFNEEEDELFMEKKKFLLSQYQKQEAYLEQKSKEGYHFVRHVGKKFYFIQGEPADYYYSINYFAEEPDADQWREWEQDGWKLVSRSPAKKKREAGWFIFRNTERKGEYRKEIDNEEEKYRFYRKYSNSCRSTMFLIFMCMAMCAVAAYLQWVFRGYLWGFALCGVVFLIAFIVFCMYGRMLRNSKKTARMLQAKLRTKERRAAFYAQHSFETDETEEELDTDWNTLEQTSQTQKLRRRSK